MIYPLRANSLIDTKMQFAPQRRFPKLAYLLVWIVRSSASPKESRCWMESNIFPIYADTPIVSTSTKYWLSLTHWGIRLQSTCCSSYNHNENKPQLIQTFTHLALLHITIIYTSHMCEKAPGHWCVHNNCMVCEVCHANRQFCKSTFSLR